MSQTCSPKVSTISERLSEDSHGFITLGSADLDRVFGTVQGGIPTGLLTEIAGESACGKTCLSLQLSLNVQLPRVLGGLQGGCIYLCTESAFPTSRLYEMSTGLCDSLKAQLSSTGSLWDAETREMVEQLSVESLMTNVHLTRVHDPQALIHTIHYYLPGFLGRQNGPSSAGKAPIRLMVLDSIGAIFRADLESSKMGKEWANPQHAKFRMTERASEINQVADGLKVLAHHYGLAVVVVNQVSDVISDPALHLSLPRPMDCQYGGLQACREAAQSRGSDSPNPEDTRRSTPSSSLSHPTSTPSSTPIGSNLGATTARFASSPIPLVYQHQAVHFTGQKATHNRKEAALGIHWTNAINTRIMLNKLTASLDSSSLQKLTPSCQALSSSSPSYPVKLSSLFLREAVLVFSPLGFSSPRLSPRPVQFVILSQGIVSVNLSL